MAMPALHPHGSRSGLALPGVIISLFAALFLVATILFRFPALPRLVVYTLAREIGKISMEIKTRNMLTAVSPHFIVKYRPQDAAMVPIVLNAAEQHYEQLIHDFHLTPPGKVQVVIYPTKEALNKSFGWDANASAMGVYFAGVIRVLSPSAWIQADDPRTMANYFDTNGPMVHEFTHLLVDYETRGNYTRWFTEGVAQYEEHKYTGFEFDAPSGSLSQGLYPLQEMDGNFDNLPNQVLAYRESYMLINYMVAQHGEGVLMDIMHHLAQGASMDGALRATVGVDQAGLLDQFRHWWQQREK